MMMIHHHRQYLDSIANNHNKCQTTMITTKTNINDTYHQQ